MPDTKSDKSKEWDNKEVGVLWKKKSQKDTTYISGTINIKAILEKYPNEDTLQIVGFANKNKTKETQPDYKIYYSEKREKPTAQTSTAKAPVEKRAPSKQVVVEEDDGLI